MKILHIKNGHIAAIAFPNENLPDYGTKVEVPADLAVSVGDPYVLETSEVAVVPETAKPAAKTAKASKAK